MIWTKFIWVVEDYSRNISARKKKSLNICSETAKIANFHFSHYKSMETICYHSNQEFLSDWNKKTKLFLSPIYRCYMWNMQRIGFTASEEKSFANVDDWWTDGRQMPAHSTSSSLSLWLRGADKKRIKYSSVFRGKRYPPPPKPVYGGKFSHEAVTLKIKSRPPKSNKLLILSNLHRFANSVTFHPMVHEITCR